MTEVNPSPEVNPEVNPAQESPADSSGEIPPLLLAGIVGAARGLKGEVFVEPRTDREDEVFAEGALVVIDPENPGENPENGDIELLVERARTHGGRLMVTFEDVTTREQAEALRGAHLLTEPAEEEDAWYAFEIEGFPVIDADGKALGTVAGIAQGAAHDLLLVKSASGAEVMVPLVKEIVLSVSVSDKQVVLDPPLGLFEE